MTKLVLTLCANFFLPVHYEHIWQKTSDAITMVHLHPNALIAMLNVTYKIVMVSNNELADTLHCTLHGYCMPRFQHSGLKCLIVTQLSLSISSVWMQLRHSPYNSSLDSSLPSTDQKLSQGAHQTFRSALCACLPSMTPGGYFPFFHRRLNSRSSSLHCTPSDSVPAPLQTCTHVFVHQDDHCPF